MKKNYCLGFLGAFVGGLIASIPWVAIYVYGNMMYSVLTVLIALGALKGYQLLGGKTFKGLPIVIAIISIICVSLANLLIIPIMIIAKEGLIPSIANLNLLYSNSEFISALIRDYIVAILFTFLGISGVIASMRKQIKEQGVENVKFDFRSRNASSKDLKKIKQYFVDHNATSSENAIKLTGKEDLHADGVEQLKVCDVIVEENGKFYYDLEKDKKNKRQVAIICSAVFGIIFIIIISLLVFAGTSDNANTNKNSSKNNTTNNKASTKTNYEEPKAYQRYDESDGTYYLPKNDLSGDSGLILVYDLGDAYEYSEDLIDTLKDAFAESEYVKNVKDSSSYKNKNKYQVLKYEVEYKEGYTDVFYYIFGNKKTVVVEALVYKEGTSIVKDADALVDTYKE